MVQLNFENLTLDNANEKFYKGFCSLWRYTTDADKVNKAMTAAHFAIRIPQGAPKGEQFVYRLNKELCNKWCAALSQDTMNIYDELCELLGLPAMKLELKDGGVNKSASNTFQEGDHPRGTNGRLSVFMASF